MRYRYLVVSGVLLVGCLSGCGSPVPPAVYQPYTGDTVHGQITKGRRAVFIFVDARERSAAGNQMAFNTMKEAISASFVPSRVFSVVSQSELPRADAEAALRLGRKEDADYACTFTLLRGFYGVTDSHFAVGEYGYAKCCIRLEVIRVASGAQVLAVGCDKYSVSTKEWFNVDRDWRPLYEEICHAAATAILGQVQADTESGKEPPKTLVSCDIRIVQVSGGSAPVSATGEAACEKLADLSKALAKKLKEGVFVKGESVAVVSFRNRSGTSQGRIIADDLADKVSGALIETGWFDVKERIDLRSVLKEQDLEAAGIVKNEAVRKKLDGVRFIVIGGVTVTDAGR